MRLLGKFLWLKKKCERFTYHKNISSSDINDRFTINELIEGRFITFRYDIAGLSRKFNISKSNALSILKNPRMDDKARLFNDIIALFGFLQALKTAYSEGLQGSIKELIYVSLQ